MKNVIWTEEYSVGVEEFDFHHKKIFSITSDIRGLKDENKKELTTFLGDLFSFGDYHLSREEQGFIEYNYPETKKHIKSHNEYRKGIKEIVKKNNEGNLKVAELVSFLEKWWLNHVLKEDKKYTKFFHENGVF